MDAKVIAQASSLATKRVEMQQLDADLEQAKLALARTPEQIAVTDLEDRLKTCKTIRDTATDQLRIAMLDADANYIDMKPFGRIINKNKFEITDKEALVDWAVSKNLTTLLQPIAKEVKTIVETLKPDGARLYVERVAQVSSDLSQYLTTS